MLNRQKVFEDCVRGLAKQGWSKCMDETRPTKSGNGFVCVYHHEDGRGCAIGVLIPRSLDTSEADRRGDGVVEFLRTDDTVRAFFVENYGLCKLETEADIPKFIKDADILGRMQALHDNATDPQSMLLSFMQYCNRQRLVWPADVPTAH